MSNEIDADAKETVSAEQEECATEEPAGEAVKGEAPEEEKPSRGKRKHSQNAELEALKDKVAGLEAESAELRNDYLRKHADFENFRKRMLREKEEAVKYANANLLVDLIGILDDFERAMKSSEESKDFDALYAGIEIIEKQFAGMLERKYGLKRIQSQGEQFNPELHEAIFAEEGDTDSQIVVEDYQKGYMLHERVLRHAKVKVLKPSDGQNTTQEEKA